MVALPETLAESERLFPVAEADAQLQAKRTWILHFVPRGAAGAEVGAGRGLFSATLLRCLKPARAWFCDHRSQPSAGAPEATQDAMPGAAARREVDWRTAAFEGIARGLVDARFPDGVAAIDTPLDWLCLTPSNDVERALAELHAAAGLLAPRGLLFGGGWWPDPTSPGHAPYQALGKFTRQGRFELVACGPYGQWAMRRRGPWKLRPDAAADAVTA